MRRLSTLAAGLATGLALLTLTACGSTTGEEARSTDPVPVPSSATAARPATSFTTWPMWHGSASHAGHVTRPAPSPLKHAWTKPLDGAVYGEPLVIGTTLVVATEKDKVYGLAARTGRVRWEKSLGHAQPQSALPCGDIDPLGITGTPAYDAKSGSVFVVTETQGGHHNLWALDPATGHRRWHRNLDVLPQRNRSAEQERSAVLVEHGRVVVSFGGLSGDCDNYVGYLTSTATSGKARTFHYAVPTAREAGMWSPAGPILGRNGNVYVAAGNGAEVDGKWDKSDSVTELTPVRLKVVSVFAPRTWAADNKADLDLGSSSPVSVPAVHRLVIAGKRGVVYLLREHSHGVGSDLAEVGGCKAFGGAAVVGRTVLMPCLIEDQICALRVSADGLKWAWSATHLYGSPVVAGDKVYVADRDTGDLVVLRLRDGSVVQRIHAGSLTHFPSEVVDGGYVFVPTLDGVSAFRG